MNKITAQTAYQLYKAGHKLAAIKQQLYLHPTEVYALVYMRDNKLHLTQEQFVERMSLVNSGMELIDVERVLNG